MFTQVRAEFQSTSCHEGLLDGRKSSNESLTTSTPFPVGQWLRVPSAEARKLPVLAGCLDEVMSKEPTADELAMAWMDPIRVASMFFSAIADPQTFAVALRRMVTPESLESWGDFQSAADLFNSIPDPGMQTRAKSAHGDDEVKYVGVVYGVEEDFQMKGGAMVSSQIITLVWRPEFGSWLVHHFGDYVLPENVPHG